MIGARAVPDWHEYFLDLCLAVATRSKDPNTNVGSVIVGPANEIRSTGYNSLPRKLDDSIAERWQRPEKYLWIIHAELNAILNAARCGGVTEGCRLYTTIIPCPECSKAIVQAGISEVVVDGRAMVGYTSTWLTPEADNRLHRILFEAGVTLTIWSPPDSST